MTLEEIDASTDVSVLWHELLAANEVGDDVRTRAVERRMRALAGHDDDRAQAHRDPFGAPAVNLAQATEAGGGM